MKKTLLQLWSLLQKAGKAVNSAVNFVIIAVLYVLGIGVSHALWRLSVGKTENAPRWKPPSGGRADPRSQF